MRFKKLWRLVAIVNTLWLLWMTLRPNPEVAMNLEVLTAPAAARGISHFWLIDIAGNIVVFVPLGAAVTLALADKRTLKSRLLWGVLSGLALSCIIELLQGLTSSRVSSLSDVALNTFGAAIGAASALSVERYSQTVRCMFLSKKSNIKKERIEYD